MRTGLYQSHKRIPCYGELFWMGGWGCVQDKVKIIPHFLKVEKKWNEQRLHPGNLEMTQLDTKKFSQEDSFSFNELIEPT